HPDLAGARHDEATYPRDGRRLAGAITAEQSHGRSLLELEANMIHRGDRAIDIGKVAHRHWKDCLCGAISSKLSAGLLAETVNSLVHELALLVRCVGIMARPRVLDLRYGRPRQWSNQPPPPRTGLAAARRKPPAPADDRAAPLGRRVRPDYRRGGCLLGA